MVPEEHASMTTTLKHFKSYETPPCTNMLSSLSIAPAVQTIIVNCVSIVDPQLAAIIRDNTEVVMPRLEDSQAASPAHCEMIASGKARPSATCVAVVHHVFPTSHIRLATL